MIYYILGLFLFLSGFLDIFNVSKKNKIFINKISLLILILFASLRWKTGTDWGSYYDYFTLNSSYNDFLQNHHKFEFLFTNITFIIRKVTENYNVYLTIYMALGIYLFNKILKKLQINYIGIAIFSYYMSSYMDFFGGIRAAMAILITLYSVEYIKKLNYKKFFFINLIAMQFHRTALIFMGAIFTKEIKLKKYNYLLICILFYILGKEEIILQFLKILYALFNDSELFIFKKLEYYLHNNSLIISEKYLLKDIVSASKRLIILYIFVLYKDKVKIKKDEYNILLNLYFVSICIYFLFSSQSLEIFKRMSIYFFSAEMLLLPILLENMKKTTNKVWIYILFSVIYFAKLNQLLMGPYGELFTPYYDIFINIGNRQIW